MAWGTPNLGCEIERSMKISCLHLQRVDMQIAHKHIPRLNDRLRRIARIRTTAMRKLIAPARRQPELGIAIRQP